MSTTIEQLAGIADTMHACWSSALINSSTPSTAPLT
jgi:hypothetical protein